MSFYWPIFLSVLSGVFYQMGSKSTPHEMDPMASLTVTYAVAALAAGVLYYLTHQDANLLKEYTHINWTSFVLGFTVIGMDLGNRYMYRMGWAIGSGYLVNSVVLSVVLLIVGLVLFHETISLSKIAGTALCLLGVGLLTR